VINNIFWPKKYFRRIYWNKHSCNISSSYY